MEPMEPSCMRSRPLGLRRPARETLLKVVHQPRLLCFLYVLLGGAALWLLSCSRLQQRRCKGIQKTKKDTCNFDKEFTKMAVEMTPTDKLFIMNLDQNEFLGFSYTNPEFVIQV
ncbi:hypothetical protein GN956_G3449 [Arapaima gigas]